MDKSFLVFFSKKNCLLSSIRRQPLLRPKQRCAESSEDVGGHRVAVRVELRMPLDTQDEGAAGVADGLDCAIQSVRFHAEAGRQTVDPLLVQGVDANPGLMAEGGKAAVRG